jgi:ubiquinone/menaquinone biosynthesis C-methylase UbiE
MGFMASKQLFIANEIGLFTALAKQQATLEELAGQLGLPTRTVRILADAMVAFGLIEREDSVYRNSAVAAAFLGGDAMSMSPMLRFFNAISYRVWLDLQGAVETGESVRGDFTEEQQKIFSEGVEAFSGGAARSLAATYDFDRHSRLLDVGGGTGSFLVAILSAQPQLHGTLFELPEVAEIAERKLAASGIAERVSILAGNALEDELPDGHDAVLLANVIHYFLPDQNLELVSRVRAAVQPSARLLLVDFWTDPTHTEPLPATLMAGEFLAMVGGDVYSEQEMNAWLAQTGWRPVERLPLAGPQSVIVAEAV